MSTPRDYYADLELPPTADINDIKKQYRKLALVWHPDRNPGREEEVNQRFQIIQSAHEILSDPDEKAKYDSSRRPSSRYPQASGVRGNPWSNAGANFPPPPRRNPAGGSTRPPPAPPPSGAQRWQSRFSQGPPPTAKQQYSAEAEAKKNAASAFDKMRRGGAQSSSRPSQQRQTNPVPPPTPARESARQRQEASFGNRKSGYYTHSTYDEPPVSNKNYASSRPNVVPPEPDHTRMPDPLRQFRETPSTENFMDNRQSTPYMSRGGEKTDPFDRVPLSKAKSAREPNYYQPEDDMSSDSRHRSSSLPRSSGQEAAGSGLNVPLEEHAQRPRTADETSSPPTRKSYPANTGSDAHSGSSHLQEDPSMYDKLSTSCLEPNTPSRQRTPQKLGKPNKFKYRNKSCGSAPSNLPTSSFANSPSGELGQASFERQQSDLLESLISNLNVLRNRSATLGSPVKEQATRPLDFSAEHQPPLPRANTNPSFSFHVDDQTFAPNSGSPQHSGANNTERADSHFADSEAPPHWQFQAGSEDKSSFEQAQSRSRSGGRPGRRSPVKQPSGHQGDSGASQDGYGQHEEGFDADGWNDKFGPQTFAPPPNAAGMSPTKPPRSNTRKASKVKSTIGTAAVVEDNTSEEDTYEWRGRQGHGRPGQVGSPQAMDIDSSPGGPPPPQPPRRVPVEPDRPEWRSGDVKQKTMEHRVPVNPNTVGSEDTEEFRANFNDFKNVAPLNSQKSTGLKSMDDLKDNLPFESKAAVEVELELPKPPVQPLAFPDVPKAPALPPTFAIETLTPTMASWEAYLHRFESYLRQWEKFNTQVVDHFTTRKAHTARKGYAFLGARDTKEVGEYYATVEQDIGVRQNWQEACVEHEKRILEFMEFKRKMMSS